MRVRRIADVREVMNLMHVISLDAYRQDGDDTYTLADLIPAPEPTDALTDPNELVSEQLFTQLKPGWERVCVILRAEGYSYQSIQDITGLSELQVRNTVHGLRQRLSTSRHPFRVWNTKTHAMQIVSDVSTLSPKKIYRVMRPTGHVDYEGRDVYEWDVISVDQKRFTVRWWKNQLGQGFSPFDTKELHHDWRRAVVVGNVYQSV